MSNDRPTDKQAKDALASLLAAAFPANADHTNQFLPSYDASQPHSSTSSLPVQTNGISSTSSAPATAPSVEFLRALAETISNRSNASTSASDLHSSPRTAAYSHTLELLAAQPSLFAGLAVAPPSPSASHRTGAAHAPIAYTPQPTRSGRVPHAPAAETDRETMLFNDYFDWPSSDDENDPDFQPSAVDANWDNFLGSGAAGPSSGAPGGFLSPDEGDDDGESDYSAVDETFVPGEGLFDVNFGPLGPTPTSEDDVAIGRGLRSRAAAASKGQLLPSTLEFNSPTSTSTSTATRRGSTRATFDTTLAPPAPPARSKRATPVTRLESSSSSPARTSPRKRTRVELSPLPEEPPVASTSRLPPPPPPPPAPRLAAAVPSPTRASTMTGKLMSSAYPNGVPQGTARIKKSAGMGPAPVPKSRKRKVHIATAVVAPTTEPEEAPPAPLPTRPARAQSASADSGTSPEPDRRPTSAVGTPNDHRSTLTVEEKMAQRRQKNREAAKESRARANRERAERDERLEFLEKEHLRLKARIRELEERVRNHGGEIGEEEEEEGSVVDSLEDSEEEEDAEELGEEDVAVEKETAAERGKTEGAFDLGQLTQEQMAQLSRLLASASRNAT